ncbi:DUF6603 domain-containing protein [Larkinella rosea]|uniref:DUF6603 domain-containing protein n=1 Tax=Larkinella rosea TaxID=2025312 RepID=A0A3P1C1C6_9BACT|nr:DUF6603 domain-containing protein [Larkinella rosea]RRB07231.1 hypothetical protein EHT25_05485 [Larkinella rosea]
MGTLEELGKHLALAVQPLKEAVSDPDHFRIFMYRMGWGVNGIPPSYANLIAKVDEAIASLEALLADPDPAKAMAVFGKIKAVYQAIEAISEAPPGVVDVPVFLDEIRERLFEILIVDYLTEAWPFLLNFFKMTGVIEQIPVRAPADRSRPSFIRFKLNWNRIPEILTQPDRLPEFIYGWGTPRFNFELFAEHFLELVYALRIPVSLARLDDETSYLYLDFPTSNPRNPRIRQFIEIAFAYLNIEGEDRPLGLSILDLPAVNNKLPGIIIQPALPAQIGAVLRIREDVNLLIKAQSNIAALFGILIRPNEITVKYPFQDGQLPSAGFGAGVEYAPALAKTVVGSDGGTRLELKGGSLEFNFLFNGNDPELKIGGSLRDFALVLKASDTDSFIRKIIGDSETRIPFTLGFEWSNKHGIKFTGGGGFEVAVYPHLRLGPISIEELLIRLYGETSPKPAAKLEVGTSIKGELGPITFVVQNIGLGLTTTFDGGNAGPFDIGLGFKPPTGVGLAVDGGGFSGGGFLFFDDAKKEYAGGLELTFSETISLNAIGILTTRMPDGSDGFSLLIIITAEFTPIQLSFGFTLNGVGGLLGINRTYLVDEIQKGVYDGSLNSVLFPQNIVANATRIINDLKRIFPPKTGHYLVAPMAKIGWGTPTLISIELGLLLEIPRPGFAILGVLRMNLPEERIAIVKIQVNFFGELDFDKGQISFDASLIDSRILTFTLTGDMALRLYYKENPNFLVSMGGFHPAYTPPPMNLPTLKRLSLVIFSGDPSLKAESYFAVTSNTVQFGSKIELSANASVFNVYGFLSLDVLIQFSPFYFIAEVAAMLAVRSGSSTLFSVKLQLTLEGPTPWHAKGKASFEIGFIFTVTISVHFYKTFGERRNDILPPVRVIDKLREALGNSGNWKADLPVGNQFVTLRELPTDNDALILHPFGTLTVTQKIVPLRLDIARFGYQLPEGPRRFEITKARMGTAEETPSTFEKEQFAPAQFIEMTDAQKLARPSFEPFDAGVRIGGSNQLKSSYAVGLDVTYELVYVPEKQKKKRVVFDRSLFGLYLGHNAIARSSLAEVKRKPSVLGAEKVTIKPETFAIATSSSLQVHQQMIFETETEAQAALSKLIRQDAGFADELQVVPSYQLN